MNRYRTSAYCALALCFLSACTQEAGVAPQDTTDTPSGSAGVEPATLPADTETTNDTAQGLPPQLLEIYRNFNMRSIPSSFGQRLKFYCESYLDEYFAPEHIEDAGPTAFVLNNGDDVWRIEYLSDTQIRIDQTITSGSYRSSSEHTISYFPQSQDWRADETWIVHKSDCVTLNDETDTPRGLIDLRDSQPAGWQCADSSDAENVAALQILRELREQQTDVLPAAGYWGASDMLMLNIRQPTELHELCTSGVEAFRIDRLPVLDAPDGEIVGQLARMSSYDPRAGYPYVSGWLEYGDDSRQPLRFGALKQENPMLLIDERAGHWLNLGSQGRHAWIHIDAMAGDVFSTRLVPYVDRMLAASEINSLVGQAMEVRMDPGNNATLIETFIDSRVSFLPEAIDGDWMKVRYVRPPNYPMLSCGDDADDFDWISGWIRWRDGDQWLIEEEHHYGC